MDSLVESAMWMCYSGHSYVIFDVAISYDVDISSFIYMLKLVLWISG